MNGEKRWEREGAPLTGRAALPLAEQAARLLGELHRRRPLVHCITNYVTANDCANILLAIGASPIMADDPEETGEIASAARALVLNMGTPSRRKLEAMVRAGKRANEEGIPVILDPVGAGASALRREMTERLVREVRVDILRGNVSEISFAAGLASCEKGVDVSEADRGIDRTEAALAAARRLGCTVAVTGEVDVVTDGRRTARIRGGSALMSRVTGTGCMTSALAGAFAGAFTEAFGGAGGDRGDAFPAAVAALASMGIAGETASERAGCLGCGSFHMALLDAVGDLNEKIIRERADIEEG